MIAMQNIEANLRTIVAYTIAENFGYLESDYLVRTIKMERNIQMELINSINF